ncbi:hypothetical protein ACJJTC_012239 [Scirpophaga incertulas]
MPPVNSKAKKSGVEYENIVSKGTALDFERYIQDNRTLLLNDPLRDILLYPTDDVSSVVLPRRWRTVTTAVPDVRTAASCPLLTRQALLSYASSWNLIHYKYNSYSGTYLNLPRPMDTRLPAEVYDIDTENECDHESQAVKVDIGTKEGYLLKGPEIGSDRIFSNLASKSFKKRYCSMIREADGAYILEVYKDDKKTDTKLTIVMDFCSDVVKNPKRGRHCFELRMAGGKGYTFSADNEDEMNEWINAFNAALKKNQYIQESNQNDDALDKDADVSLTAEPPPPVYGTLKGLEHSMNPLLMRYSRETDMSIAAARNECRSNIFNLPYKRAPSPEPQLEPFKEHFGQRILLKCESLKFRLQAPIDGDKELLCQVEPYYTYLALYDARSGRKLTENFHFDVNNASVKDLVKDTDCTKSLVENFSCDVKLDVNQIPEEWFRAKKQAVLSVNNPHPDLFLVVKIDKILQGHVSQVLEPYLKATKDPRLGLKVHKTVQAYANRVGSYRMPFAWTAKPLFRLYSNDLDTTPEFPAIYRQEPYKMSDEDLLKILADFRKPEKLSKLSVIPGWMNINIYQSNEPIPNSMTSAYAALKPFPLPPAMPLTLELATLSVEPEQPYAAYIHHLYVRPLSLNFESQKVFARARNIACSVELKDCDSGDNKPLQVVYGRAGMTTQYRCSVLHHNANPTWCDEVKIRLPATITAQHHLLFSFYHISCDIAKKNDINVESCIGYAWVPLLKNDRFVEEIVNLPVATHLPSGYLAIQPLGLGKGNTGPDVVWVEAEKQLFRCQLVLDSTVATRDSNLHNLFSQIERLIRCSSPPTSPSPPPWNDVCNALKNAQAIKLSSLVAFLPTILNQLFELMTVEKSYNKDIGYQIVKLIVHFVHMIHDFGRKDLLDSYVKSCLSFMDRGFVFRQIKKYVDKFKVCDAKALFDFKFTFLQTICSHEHFVPFNLPLHATTFPKDCNDDPAKLKLTEEFIMRHFLAGTLLKQVEQSLREAPQKRRTALSVLRSLLTKHEHDDRYRTKQCRSRLAQLYAPWLTIVLENAHRLVTKALASPVLENGHDRVDGDVTAIPVINNVQKEVTSASSTPRRNRLTLHFEHTPARHSAHFKDPPVIQNNQMYGKDHTNNMSQSSLESVSTMSGGDSLPRNMGRLELADIGDQVNRFGVMSAEEVRDVLLCFLFVLKYLDDERLVEWWKTHSQAQQQSFFNVLEICAEQFQYVGKKKILSELKTSTPDSNGKPKPIKARTLPARMSPPDFSKEPPIAMENKNNTVNRENLATPSVTTELETIAEHAILSAGCLATEVGLTIIDRACLFMKNLGAADGIAAKPYLKLLHYPQSETLYKHLFAALRAYINQFSETLFEVSAVVKLCEARAAWLRREAAAALYLLMRANFQHGSGGSLTRVHLQVIIAVSKLLDNSTALNCKRFQESLSVINCFATGDKAMKGTGLSNEVAELMRRVRTVVGARARLAGVGGSGGSNGGSVHLAELQHALAASCRATPRLRHAWLATLAEHHARHGDHDEAMCCQLHIAALIAEYLKQRGTHTWGADEFAEISRNIPRDEVGIKIDEGMTDVQYNEQALLDQLMICTEYVDKAERYELLGPLYRLVIPIYERRKDYQALLNCYQHLTKAYAKVIEVTNSGKRLLGRFYRVAFFGKAHFGDDEEGVEFIYKEPKLTSLSEISEKLQTFYEQKFGVGHVKMIMDSAPVNRDELDSKLAYIQVTWVRGAPEGVTVAGTGEGSFERAHNVRRFVFETPFTRDGGARGPVHHQRLRLTHLTAESWFPYVKRRVPVVETHVEEKSPIEVAVAEMESQVTELTEIVNAKAPDIKKLQLRLQGSICVQVNAGPQAYANAFLDPTLAPMYPDDMVDKLKSTFKEFLTICHSALQLNGKLISSDQVTYHEALESNYYKLSDSLSSVLGQPLQDILVNGNLSTTVTGVELESSNA